jgi:lipopolysaccharide export system permease protein
MKIYIRFIVVLFFKSFFYVLAIMSSLVFILNLLGEIDFFRDLNTGANFTLFLSLLNSPDMIFEMFPFIFLLTTQLFFIKLIKNNEIEVFKYSGLKNSKILSILSIISFISGVLIIVLFYNFSSSLKNFYLELKSNYTIDGKYLAVVTKNGLWIRDIINNKILVINASKIENNYLIGSFITEFDNEYNVLRNIKSDKIDIINKEWIIYNGKIFNKNNYELKSEIRLLTNFDYKRIQTLYSNLSSLNILQLFELRKNYEKLNYSTTEVNLQLLKLITVPLYLFLITIFASLIMFKIKRLENTTLNISLGLFFSVVIYYINNFFFVLGSTEKISVTISIFLPLLLLTMINVFMINNVNEK